MDKTEERLKKYMKDNRLELVGHVGINTGTVLITDPVDVIPDSKYDEYVRESMNKFDEGNEAHEIFHGVESMTGYGDGSYPVFISKNDEGRVMEVRIRFDLTYGFTETNGPYRHIVVDELWNKVLERDTGKDPLV